MGLSLCIYNDRNNYVNFYMITYTFEKTLHNAVYVHYLHEELSNHDILTMKYLVAWQVYSLSQSTSDIQLSLSLFYPPRYRNISAVESTYLKLFIYYSI